MKKIILLISILLFTGNLAHSLTVQAGIFSSGNDLIIKAKTDGSSTNYISAITLTIKYETSYGISLSSPVSIFNFDYNVTNYNGIYTYKTYSFADGTLNPNWLANTENEILRVTISGGSGMGYFELANDAYINSLGMILYIEQAVSDITNYITPLYQPNISFPMPVELVNFTSNVNYNNIQLKWSTSKEINNKGFYFE